MLGFVINPLTLRIIKTGLVYISTNPPDASVFIDGRQAPQNTPTVLRDLSPGEHFIRVELTGYNDWERNIPIVAKKATVLDNILLIPQVWPIKIISSQSYQNITVARDILVATNPVLKDIDIYRGTGGGFNEEGTYEKTPLFTKKSVYADGNLLRSFNAPQSPYLLLEADIKDKHKFLWVNLNENPPIIEDISDLFVDIPHRIAWDNADNENIFAFYANNIYRINIKDKAIYFQSPDSLPKGLGQRSTEIIQDKFLINDNNDLLIRGGAQIKIFPKEDFGSSREYDIARSKPSTNMYFEERNGELFYLDNDTSFLYAAQILPFKPILNIPIPDALRFTVPKKEQTL